jgi:CMP-N-acetylneuraminic acid synthetase
MKPTVCAIIPMRHSSRRVPGKNYRAFAGRPLYHHIVQSLRRCREIAQIVIDTDSEAIREDAARNFPDVTVLNRPPELRSEMTSMNDVLLHTTSVLRADLYLQTHSTNPLLMDVTISRAIERFISNSPACDSLFAATRRHVRLWDYQGRAVNHDPAVLQRTQDLTPLFEENSCIYIFTRKSLQTCRNRIGRRPILFEIDRCEAMDIDEEIDFRLAELMYLHLQEKSAKEAA